MPATSPLPGNCQVLQPSELRLFLALPPILLQQQACVHAPAQVFPDTWHAQRAADSNGNFSSLPMFILSSAQGTHKG